MRPIRPSHLEELLCFEVTKLKNCSERKRFPTLKDKKYQKATIIFIFLVFIRSTKWFVSNENATNDTEKMKNKVIECSVYLPIIFITNKSM